MLFKGSIRVIAVITIRVLGFGFRVLGFRVFLRAFRVLGFRV